MQAKFLLILNFMKEITNMALVMVMQLRPSR